MTSARTGFPSLFVALALAASACSDNGDSPSDGSVSDSGVSDAGGDAGTILPAEFFPAPAPAFGANFQTPRAIAVSASGEALSQFGYAYSANPGPDDLVFVDGWSVRFDHVYVVVTRVAVHELGPDPSVREGLGALVAERRGPWLVDLSKVGPISGASGAPETAHPITVIEAPTAGGQFDTTRRYAFAYETGAPTSSVRNVNLVAADREAAEEMVRRGWSTYLIGTATYSGRPATASVDPTFVAYPTSVTFRLGFGAPAGYINCHNPDLGQDPEEPGNWGLQPSDTGAIRAQLTFHTDHTFWDQLEIEGSPLHFDPFAARASNFGTAGGEHVVTMEDLAGVNPAALTDRNGEPVLDRGVQTSGYQPNSPPPSYSLNGVPAAEVPDLRAFVAYLTRGFGHLNADGECFVAPGASLQF